MTRRPRGGGGQALAEVDPDMPPQERALAKASALLADPTGSDVDAARVFLRPHLAEILTAVVREAKRGGGRALTFVRDVMGYSQASLNVQILIAERLGVPLEDAKRAVDAVQQVPETLDGIQDMNCRFLAWVVRQHPERAEAIRAAIFGAAVEVGE